jgi:hypothetical protein
MPRVRRSGRPYPGGDQLPDPYPVHAALTRKENLPVITITVETEEEFKAAADALRDGLLHEMIGGEFRISVEQPEGEHGPNR